MNGERRYKQPNFILFMVDSILFSLIPLNVICVTHGRKIEGDEAPKREKN